MKQVRSLGRLVLRENKILAKPSKQIAKNRPQRITTENSRIGAKDVRGPDIMGRTQGNVLH